jgi:Lrp/AsnC family transcriptional regulator for asnA, asnC and gidA
VVAVTDMAAFGYHILVGAWIEVRGRSPVEVGGELAEIAEVPAVTLMLGRHDLFATVIGRDHQHLSETVHRIKAIAGIASVEWDLALDVLVYRSEWGVLSQDGHPPLPQPGPGIDDFDLALIGKLQRDGRMSNRRLAAESGVSEAMIRARIRRMEQAGAIRIVAVTDVARYGMTGSAVAGIKTEAGAAPDVAARLATNPALPFVATTLGPHDVLVSIVVRDRSEMLRVVLEELDAVPGVTRTDPSEFHMVLKHSFSWVRLPRPDAALASAGPASPGDQAIGSNGRRGGGRTGRRPQPLRK